MPNRVSTALYHRSPSMLYGRPRTYRGVLASALGAPFYALAGLPYSPYPPDPNDPAEFGIDVSLYNGDIDFEAVAAFDNPKIKYVMVRQSISWGYEDPLFVQNWEGFKQYTDIPRMFYHVIYSSQDVFRQLDNIERIANKVQGDLGEGPAQEDWELSNGQPKNAVSNRMGQMLEEGPKRFNHRFGGYSAKWFMDGYAEPQPWWATTDWWLAHYLHPSQQREHPGPPARPAIIPKKAVKFRQSSSYVDGRILGVPGNIRVDANRFELWDEMPVEQHLGTESPDPPPDPADEISIGLATIKADAAEIQAEAERLQSIVQTLES